MLIDKLNWRYATKKMDPSKTVSDDKIERILEAANLAPTSSGLQPFEILLVKDKDLREKLKVAANGQAQLTDGTAVLVFAAWDNYTKDRIDSVFDRVNTARGTTSEGWENYRKTLTAAYVPRPEQVNFEHAARQAYIAFGLALTAAAFEGVDATPMEGFNPDAVDEILGLRARGLRSVTLMPIGYRDANGDWLANLTKVRKSRTELVTVL